MPLESPRGILQLIWFLFPLFKVPSSLKLKSLRPRGDRVLSQKFLHRSVIAEGEDSIIRTQLLSCKHLYGMLEGVVFSKWERQPSRQNNYLIKDQIETKNSKKNIKERPIMSILELKVRYTDLAST